MMRRLLAALVCCLALDYSHAHADDPDDNVTSYAWGFVQCVNGHPAVLGPQPLGNDKVGVSSWCYRGPGGWSPLYGGNFGVHFESPGPVVGLEIDVNNHSGDAGPAAYGEHVGLWLNRSGDNSSTALRISSQGPNAWHYGIHFDPGGTGDAALIDTVGIYCNGCMRDTFQESRPMDDVDGDWWTLLDASGERVKATIRKRGAFLGRAASTGAPGPTFAWTDEPGSGMYLAAPGQIAFSLRGQEALKITDTALVFQGRAGMTGTVAVGGCALSYAGGLLVSITCPEVQP